MAVGDMPHLSTASYASTAYGLNDLSTATGTAAPPFVAGNNFQALGATGIAPAQNFMMRGAPVAVHAADVKPRPPTKEETPMAAAPSRRLVQVFIADPDENVPLKSSLLYSGEQKLTDATDQELFFEIDMKSILDKHNELRKTLINKKVKERTEYLEPTKIRDLRMVVVNVASF